MSRKLKDSGIPWIGQVPEGWKMARIAALYDLRSEKCSDKDFQPLSVTMKGIVPQLEDVAKTNNGDERKLVRAGDFVINSRSDRRGSCGISRLDGSVSLINTVLQPRGVMNPDYYNWVFHSPEFADEFYAWGHGIVDDLWTTRWSDMKSILVPTPPLSEQKAIAEYLDRKCAEIDGLREKIEKQIATLEEYKKSLITESVTRGLDPNAPMKDSGVPWIGQVPEGWKVMRLSYLYDIQLGKMLDTKRITGEFLVPYLRNQDVQWGKVNFDELPEMDINPDEREQFLVKRGDLLVCEGGEIGRSAIWDYDWSCYIQKAIMRLRSRAASVSSVNYLYHLMFAMAGLHIFDNATGKATIAHLPAEKLSCLRIPSPPLPEQKAIAEFLDGKCAEIDAETEKCRGMLERLEEYRKSLIFECVTGKKEVV